MSNLRRIGVIGCGLMGSGIAGVCARATLDVSVFEVDARAVDAGRIRIENSLDRAVSRGKLSTDERDTVLSRIRLTTELDTFADRDLVVEAIVESEQDKADMFARLDKIVTSPDAILASNTSSIPIMKLQSPPSARITCSAFTSSTRSPYCGWSNSSHRCSPIQPSPTAPAVLPRTPSARP